MSLILVFFMWVSYVNACPLSYCTNCYGGGWGGPSSCGQCQTYYGVYNSYCLPCNYNQSNCQLCSTTNWNACITCMTGYALNTTTAKCFNCNLNGGCDLCQPTNSGTIVCTKCHIRHVLISPNCFQCLDPKCLECQASNQNICTKCEDYYGVDLLGGQNCVSCDVTNCLDCSTNRTTCYACIDGYGVDMNYGVASCRPCSDSDCIICAQDYRICTFCSPGLGPRVYADWSCGRCNYRYCELCSAHRFICTYCQLGYGVSRIDSVNYECKDCADANCLNCSQNYTVCNRCFSSYGMDQNSLCVRCQPICRECQLLNYQECTSCFSRHFLSTTTRICQPCGLNCRTCNSYTQCTICDTGYVQDSGFCIRCADHCTTCDPLLILSSFCVQCTGCEPFYEIRQNSSSADCPVDICKQICGDNIVIAYPCDNDVNVSYDGCTDSCEIENGFTCVLDNSSLSVCSYHLPIVIDIISLQRIQRKNSFTLKAKISPPLHVFKTTNNVCGLFRFPDSIYAITSCLFDSINSELTFQVDFFSDVVNEDIILQFVPSTNADERYFDSVVSTGVLNIQIYFYNQFSMTASPIINYLSYFVVGGGWICVFVGIFMKRLAGIQAMTTIQLAWVSLLWLNSNMYQPFKQAKPLLYSTGIHPNLFQPIYITPTSTSTRLLLQPTTPSPPAYPYTKTYQLNRQLLSNNFNILLIFQILPLFAYFILLIILKCFRNRHEKLCKEINTQQQIREINRKITNTVIVKENSQQLLMYFGMLNIIYFVECVFLFLRYNMLVNVVGNESQRVVNGSTQQNNAGLINIEISSIVVMGVAGLIYVFTIVLFCCDPDPFSYFRYSFKKQVSTLGCWTIYIGLILSSVICMSILPQLSWAPMVPIAVLMAYVVAFRPYKQNYENYRLIFNIFTMLSCLSLRVFLQYNGVPVNQSNNAYIIHLLNILFLVIVVILTFISLAYYLYYEKFIKPKLQKNYQNKVMLQLDQTNVRYNMMNIQNQRNIFKQILDPRMNILNVANAVNMEDLEKQGDFGEHSQRIVNDEKKKASITDQEIGMKKQLGKIQKQLKSNMNMGRQIKPEDTQQNNGRRILKQLMKQQRIDKNTFDKIMKTNIQNQNDRYIGLKYINYNDTQQPAEVPKQTIKFYFDNKVDQINKQVDTKYNKGEEQEQQVMDKKKFAMDILSKQREFLRLKNANDYTKEKILNTQDKNKVQYVNAYEDINNLDEEINVDGDVAGLQIQEIKKQIKLFYDHEEVKKQEQTKLKQQKTLRKLSKKQVQNLQTESNGNNNFPNVQFHF